MNSMQDDTMRQHPFRAPLLDMMVIGGETCARAFLAYQQELLRFAAARLQSRAELGSSLAQSRDWFEAAAVQQRWLSAAMADWARETQRLLQMSSDLAVEHAHQAEQRAHGIAQAAADTVRQAADQAQSAMQTGESAMRHAVDAATGATQTVTDEALAASDRAARRSRRAGE
jgi:hypothetical protein